MTSTPHRLLAAAAGSVCAWALTAVAPPVLAQTAPQIIVPSAPAKPSAPRTLGGKAPVGKMLSRDELRACLKRLDEVNTGSKDLEARRAALDKEKEDLAKSGETLKTERADVDTKLAAVREWETRMRAHGGEVEAFNQRLKAAETAPANQREALGKELDAERERLTKSRAPLADEEARLVPAYQNAVKGYNDKAQVRDAQVADWNNRNKSVNESAAQHEEARSSWLAECANRPYREDDEIAIKRGK